MFFFSIHFMCLLRQWTIFIFFAVLFQRIFWLVVLKSNTNMVNVFYFCTLIHGKTRNTVKFFIIYFMLYIFSLLLNNNKLFETWNNVYFKPSCLSYKSKKLLPCNNINFQVLSIPTLKKTQTDTHTRNMILMKFSYFYLFFQIFYNKTI